MLCPLSNSLELKEILWRNYCIFISPPQNSMNESQNGLYIYLYVYKYIYMFLSKHQDHAGTSLPLFIEWLNMAHIL